MRLFSSLLLGLCVMTTTSCTHPGQRLLTFQIELDGQLAFEGKRGVPDNTPVDEMWNELGEVSFKAKTAGPVSGELDGDVVIRIKHVDRELAKVSLTALSLQADTAESAWSIDSAEGERIKTATTK